jgi:hypothetical protein
VGVARNQSLAHIDLFDDPAWDSPEGRRDAATDELMADLGQVDQGSELTFIAIVVMALTLLAVLLGP